MADSGQRVIPYSPDCSFCCEDLSVGRPAAHWCIPGTWMFVPSEDRFVFVVHPSVGQIEFFHLPNGQLALGGPKRDADPSLHYHEACIRHLMHEDEAEEEEDFDFDGADEPTEPTNEEIWEDYEDR